MKGVVLILGLVLALAAAVGTATAGSPPEPVAVLYFDRPPWYLTEDAGAPGGVLIARARRIFQEAGLEHRFHNLPPRRILAVVFQGARACGVGWFRTPERAEKALFSEPLYKDRPLSLVVNRQAAARLPENPTLDQALASGLTLALIEGFSYGSWADQALASRRATHCPAGSQDEALRMVARRRCHMTLINQEEAAWRLSRDSERAAQLKVLMLKDAPRGNQRRLMCGTGVSPQEMERLNQAITRLFPSLSH